MYGNKDNQKRPKLIKFNKNTPYKPRYDINKKLTTIVNKKKEPNQKKKGISK
jgi:hypothetical protein